MYNYLISEIERLNFRVFKEVENLSSNVEFLKTVLALVQEPANPPDKLPKREVPKSEGIKGGVSQELISIYNGLPDTDIPVLDMAGNIKAVSSKEFKIFKSIVLLSLCKDVQRSEECAQLVGPMLMNLFQGERIDTGLKGMEGYYIKNVLKTVSSILKSDNSVKYFTLEELEDRKELIE